MANPEAASADRSVASRTRPDSADDTRMKDLAAPVDTLIPASTAEVTAVGAAMSHRHAEALRILSE